LEKKKTIGIVLFVAALVFVLINLLAIYPYISCGFAPMTFWLLAVSCVVVGLLLYFDVQIFHAEEA